MLVGACQPGTVWAGLCLIHHHHHALWRVFGRSPSGLPDCWGLWRCFAWEQPPPLLYVGARPRRLRHFASDPARRSPRLPCLASSPPPACDGARAAPPLPPQARHRLKMRFCSRAPGGAWPATVEIAISPREQRRRARAAACSMRPLSECVGSKRNTRARYTIAICVCGVALPRCEHRASANRTEPTKWWSRNQRNQKGGAETSGDQEGPHLVEHRAPRLREAHAPPSRNGTTTTTLLLAAVVVPPITAHPRAASNACGARYRTHQ